MIHLPTDLTDLSYAVASKAGIDQPSSDAIEEIADKLAPIVAELRAANRCADAGDAISRGKMAIGDTL